MPDFILTATAEIHENNADFKNPYLAYAKFVFTDDQPNKNHQGVRYEDFPQLAASAIDMPVKLRFLSNQLGSHKASIPIGHIKSIEEVTLPNNVHQLIAEAPLYAEEYPAEVEFLRDAHKNGQAPNVSWELGYESDLVLNGTTWKTKPVAKAATFVRQAAYGTRTALLALASLNDTEIEQGLTALASEIESRNVSQGGTETVTEQEYKDKIAELEKQLANALKQISDGDSALKTAQAEVDQKETEIKDYKKVQLIADRTQKVVEAGFKLDKDPEKAKARQEFYASLPQEVFDQYFEDLKAAAAKASKVPDNTAFASLKKGGIPKLVTDDTDDSYNIGDIGKRLRGISRGYTVNNE